MDDGGGLVKQEDPPEEGREEEAQSGDAQDHKIHLQHVIIDLTPCTPKILKHIHY